MVQPTAQSAAEATSGRLMRLSGAASVTAALALVLLKIWAWLATDSVALLSSLADSVLDLVASLVTFLAVRVALTPADREHRFGHGKSESIAGVVQALIITGSAAFVGYRAIVRLSRPSPVEAPEIGYLVMGIALLVTIALVLLHRHVIRHTGSIAVRADAAHYSADVATNVSVIVAILLSDRFGWLYADPILALFVVALILYSVHEILRNALNELLDHELPSEARERIRALALEHPDVLGIHDMRTRSSGISQFIQLHIELDSTLTLERVHTISDQVEARLRDAFPRAEVLIHADPHGIGEPRDSF